MQFTSTSQNDPPLVGLHDIKPAVAITGWEDFFKDGEGFFNTAKGAFVKEKTQFTPEILYNIIAMAIEKYIMAALMRHGALPYNHTMADMIEAMEETFADGVAELKDGLLKMDSYQEICDPEEFTIIAPRLRDIPEMLDLASGMRELALAKFGLKEMT